ncbi:hypothetical protein QW131_23185 [Roseibium salinum]|nr:hypothetical protein [Roseibium salinum]
MALLLNTLLGLEGGTEFLGMTAVGWLSYLIVCVFQVALFMKGIDWVGKFLNWAGPFVYLVMIALCLVIWWKAGNGIFAALGTIFRGQRSHRSAPSRRRFRRGRGHHDRLFRRGGDQFRRLLPLRLERNRNEARQLLGPAGVDGVLLVHRAVRDRRHRRAVR